MLIKVMCFVIWKPLLETRLISLALLTKDMKQMSNDNSKWHSHTEKALMRFGH